jgi:hypothetical protein
LEYARSWLNDLKDGSIKEIKAPQPCNGVDGAFWLKVALLMDDFFLFLDVLGTHNNHLLCKTITTRPTKSPV